MAIMFSRGMMVQSEVSTMTVFFFPTRFRTFSWSAGVSICENSTSSETGFPFSK